MPLIRKPPESGVVQAFRAYDRKLRVRWSWERSSWAIEAPIKRRDMLVPPVFFETIPGTRQRVERLLPERSDKRIAYRDGYVVIGWTPTLDWNTYEEIVRSDTNRFRSRNELYDRVNKLESGDKRQQENERKDRVKEARKKYNWLCNKNNTPY